MDDALALNQDSIYWILGGLALVLFVLFSFIFYRTGRSRTQDLEQAFPPPVPPSRHESQLAAAAKDRPANELAPAEPLQDGAPADDVPADLQTRPGGSLPAYDRPVRPHSLEEIQLQEPKPLSAALANTRNSFLGRMKNL